MSTASEQPADIPREIVDVAAVSRWLAADGRPDGPITDVRRIGGGTQNVVLRMTWAGRDVVLRRPPEHPRASSNAAMRREMQVLGALAGTDVPHPALVATCDDESVLGGVVFYLMEAVDGVNPGDALAGPYVDDPGARHAAALDTAAALATLAAVDHRAIGLDGMGKPEGFLERQVPRWLAHLESYRATPGYPGPALPHVAEVAGWLEAHRPASFRPGIVHGDYHLNNVLLSVDEPRVAAIVDWEMCTIGDPLLDLGWLLVTWPGADPPTEGTQPLAGGPFAAAGGLPDGHALAEHYAARSDRDLTGLDWYTALAGFKLGIVLEGTHARWHAGEAEKETALRLHRSASALLTRAAEISGAT